MKKLLMTLVCVLAMSMSALASPPEKTHTIKEGETLHTIATYYKTTVDAIKKANPGIENMFVPGVKVKIPAAASETATQTTETKTEPVNADSEVNTSVYASRQTAFSYFGANYYAPFKTGKGYYGLKGMIIMDSHWGGVFGVGLNLGLDEKIPVNGRKVSVNSGELFYVGPLYGISIVENVYAALPVTILGTWGGVTYTENEYGYGETVEKFQIGLAIMPEIGFRYNKLYVSAGVNLNYLIPPGKTKVTQNGMEGEIKFKSKPFFGFSVSLGYDI